MDHVKALNEHSAERYLLGELSAVEAEEFERHYFECQECALSVHEGQALVENTRAVLGEAVPEKIREREAWEKSRESFWDSLRAWWRQPAAVFAAAAVVLLGALSLYQGAVVIPGLRHDLGDARVLPAFQLASASRGSPAQITIPPNTTSFAVSVDVPPDVQFPQYLCELSAGGRTSFRIVAPAPAPGQPITILVPSKNLQAGSYELAIYGADSAGQQRDRVSTFEFTLEYH